MYAQRIALLKSIDPPTLTGIDFVTVEEDQVHLNVYFHVDPATITDPFSGDNPITPSQISIVSTSGGESVPVVKVIAVDVDNDGVERLVLTVDQPGDFSRYRLTITDDRLDFFFRSAELSFKVNCEETRFDCKPAPPACAPAELVDFPVDYMARDFLSLRAALLDLASQRYPEWREPLEADLGVMLLEVLSALGDELAYTQDRVAREAFLATATQRRSVRRLARLVDYTIHDGRSGSTFLHFKLLSDLPVLSPLRAGDRVWATSDQGETVPFELGTGLTDTLARTAYPVRVAWNSLAAHLFDDEDAAELPAGSTEIYLDNEAGLVTPADWNDKWVLIAHDPEDPADPTRRHFVRVIDALAVEDLVKQKTLLHLTWGPEHALPWCIGLDHTEVHGNVVPATAGEHFTEYFEIRGDTPDTAQAVEREGPRSGATGEHSTIFLHSLLSSETGGLGRLGDDLRAATPELRVARVVAPDVYSEWHWRRTLLGSTAVDEHYTLDDGTWRRVIGFQRATVDKDFVHVDYASGDGSTLRFGDGEFGRTPADGQRFRVDYRTGPGASSNVAPGTIRNLVHPVTKATDLTQTQRDCIDFVENPLRVTDGVDPEDLDQIKQLAPEEFRAVVHRAVTPQDYCDIVGRLEWVQNPGVRLRWTGSWPSYYITPDPIGSFKVSDDQRAELVDLLDCVRQAGREVHVLDPRYRAVDIEVLICVKRGYLPSDVRDSVLRRLNGDSTRRGYFHVDTFTFGMPIHRLTLEGIIGAVPGVLGIKSITIGARGVHEPREMEVLYVVPDNEILRLANDPRTPERGSLRVYTEGGV